IVVHELCLIQQTKGIRVTDDTFFDERIADNIIQFLGYDNDFSHELTNRFIQIDNLRSHYRRSNGFPGFLNNQGLSLMFSETHFLDKYIHNDQRDNWDTNRVIFDVIYLKNNDSFITQTGISLFIKGHFKVSPFVELFPNEAGCIEVERYVRRFLECRDYRE